jgi:hypothetical protein
MVTGMSMKEIVKMIEYGMKCICAGNDGSEVKQLHDSTFDDIVARAILENDREKQEQEAEVGAAKP